MILCCRQDLEYIQVYSINNYSIFDGVNMFVSKALGEKKK